MRFDRLWVAHEYPLWLSQKPRLIPMSMMTFSRARFADVPLLFAAIWLGFFTLLRLGLMASLDSGQLAMTDWPDVLTKGLMFDMATLAFTTSPVFLYEAILPNRWRISAWHRRLRAVWLWVAIFVMLFGVVSEVTFWIEFSTRFNFIAVDYLLYTQEVIGNIRQSYPITAILATIGVLAACLLFGVGRLLQRIDDERVTARQRLVLVAAAFCLPVLSYFSANVDQMEGMGNAYAAELSGNGLFTLAAAMRRNELDFDKFYQTMPQRQADAILREMGVERQPLGEALKADDDEDEDLADDVLPFTRRPKNVVLISVESLSASFLGSYGAPQGLTPKMDELARNGLRFAHVYATGTRTVRGLEALSLGTPPVPGQSIVRRPRNEHLATLGEVLKPQGVTPYFFYGGYGYFDNMNAYFDANSYQVVDRTDIPKPAIMFENVWGVADEVLFNQALKTLGSRGGEGQPFFAHIMTTSNHRPYTYPDGRIDIKSPGGRVGAVKYTDFAIGEFIDKARSQPWFKDTLFIIIADHCASVAGKSKLPLNGYKIPLIFYGPELVKVGVYEPMVSQLDLAPTIVEVLGKRGDDLFFGRSFFEDGVPLDRAFVSNYQSLGYLRKDILTVLLPKQKVESYRVDPRTLEITPMAIDTKLMNEAIAYYQTASRAFKQGALQMPADF